MAIELGSTREADGADERFEAAAYPASVQIALGGGAFLADARQGHPAEQALLAELGFDAMLAVGAPAERGGWLLEVFADGRTLPLAGASAAVRAMVAAALAGR
jgi:hypothetical protein